MNFEPEPVAANLLAANSFLAAHFVTDLQIHASSRTGCFGTDLDNGDRKPLGTSLNAEAIDACAWNRRSAPSVGRRRIRRADARRAHPSRRAPPARAPRRSGLRPL